MKWGIFANVEKPKVKKVISRIMQFAQRSGIEVLLEKKLVDIVKTKRLLKEREICKEADFLFAIGGDGTFLRVARINKNMGKPIIGINVGTLGFLTEVPASKLSQCLKLLYKGNYRIEKRAILKPCVEGEGKKIYPIALNDVVISKQDISRVIWMKVYVNKRFVTEYMADGVIIATPTGSTAYNLSAGGPVVSPDADVICITPICPHTLTHRPLIVSGNDTIMVVVERPNKGMVLTIDGQVGRSLNKGDKIFVSRERDKVPMVAFKKISYYDLLREKLNWGYRSRDGKR